jgi:hypothetical protein
MTRPKARRKKGIRIRKRRHKHATTVIRKGTLKPIAGRKIHHRYPNSFGRGRMQRLRK